MNATPRTALATLLLSCAAGAPAAAQCLAAATIDTVMIENAGVADGGGLADALHIQTRPGVIRRTVLLRGGECYDASRVAESERALWALGVFRAVRIDTLRTARGRLALRVATADGWSARPVADYARTGAHTSWEAGVLDANFLGTASQFFASYRSTPDRDWLAVQYSTRHLVFPGSMLWARYSRLSNGRRAAWLVGLPFREAAARHSALLEGEAVEERALLFGERTVEAGSRVRALRLRATVAYAPLATSRGYLRLWAGGRWREESWAATAADPYLVGTYAAAGAGFEAALVRFRTTRRLNTYGRPEWVDLSPTLRLGVWAAPRTGWGVELHSRLAAQWPRGHAALQLSGSGGWAAGALDSGQARARLTVVAQAASRHTAIVHGDAGRMLGARPPGAFDLWFEQRGPRLFAPHAFVGREIWWALAEDRVAVRESVAGLVAVGVAPFVEYASVRGGWTPPATGGDAGVALRLVPLRFAAGDVTEVALGYRFGSAARQPGWALGVRKGFWF